MTYSLARAIPANMRIREVARPGRVGEHAEDWRRWPRSIVGKNVLAFRNQKSEEGFFKL